MIFIILEVNEKVHLDFAAGGGGLVRRISMQRPAPGAGAVDIFQTIPVAGDGCPYNRADVHPLGCERLRPDARRVASGEGKA